VPASWRGGCPLSGQASSAANYERMFGQLQDIALMGPDAMPTLERIAADYRAL
jgi:hypothetical protein